MINKKIAMSAMSIVTALALAGGATFAFFSDEGTSSDNIFSAGTLDLKLSDDTPETDQDSVTASFGGLALGPNECTTTQQLRVKNSGSVNANHAEIAVANAVTDVPDDSAPLDMDAYLLLDLFQYDGGNISIPDSNLNGFADLDDLEANGVDNLALTDLGPNHNIDLRICLHSTAPNEVQGDSVDSDWTITLNQDASQ